MQPVGYVVLQHSVRLDRPVKAYNRWIARIPKVYRDDVLNQPGDDIISLENDPHCLALLKNYQSLMPMAQEARKPIFHLKPADGAIGSQTNYRDLLVTKGSYGAKQFKPIIPLSDGVGEVVAVGVGVTRVQVGDRVAGIFMQKFLSGELTQDKSNSALGGAIDGVLASYVVFDEQGIVKVPEHLSNEEAATLPCAAVTAWNALVVEGQLKAGDTVLLQGTGGVSLFALQFAKILGARVILISSSDEKLQKAQQLGVDIGINYKDVPDWEEKVWALTDTRGVDLVVEVGGAGTLSKSLRAVRYGGRIALIGVLTGTAGDVSTVSILHKHVRVQGIYVGSRDMFEDMNRAIAQHKLQPVVDRIFSFTEAKEALTYLESAAHFGKIVISHFPD